MSEVKHCPRCGGDLLVNEDYDGLYESCLQCGRRYHNITITTKAEEPAHRRRSSRKKLAAALSQA